MEEQKNVSPNGGRPDPTYNVSELVNAAVQRLDDLAEVRYNCVKDEIKLNKEILNLHIAYTKQLSIAESNRIDAIRAVDVNARAIDNERSNQQASVLANQVQQSAETLRNLVSTTAVTVANQFSTVINPLVERITLLEKNQYVGAGKSGGMDKLWALIVGGLILLFIIYNSFIKK